MRALIGLAVVVALGVGVSDVLADKGRHRQRKDKECVTVLPPANAAEQMLRDIAKSVSQLPLLVQPGAEQEIEKEDECNESK